MSNTTAIELVRKLEQAAFAVCEARSRYYSANAEAWLREQKADGKPDTHVDSHLYKRAQADLERAIASRVAAEDALEEVRAALKSILS
ncbi:MAG: hypothetical protein ACO29V_05990 [Limnohabitans sp.]